ncbi:MAG: CHASE2 domain-containing protein, partial [Pseudomonadota bacterium]
MAEKGEGNGQQPARNRWLARSYRSISEAGEIQIIVAVLIVLFSVFVGKYSWTLPDGETPTPLTNAAERAFYDIRAYYSADMVEPDDRVVAVVFFDETLYQLEKRSPLPREVIASALRYLDDMNPKAIGIDILFDQPQEADFELIETLRGMKTPVSVAYANTRTNEDDIGAQQQEYLEAFLAELEGSNSHPASIRLDAAFGATRVWPSIEPDLPPVLGRSMVGDAGGPVDRFAGYEGAIEFRRSLYEDQTGGEDEEGDADAVSAPLFSALDISLFIDPDPAILPFLAEQIEGKYVIIGGDIVDYDRKEVTFTSIDGDEPAGIYVHAEMIAQMLDGNAMTPISEAVKWALAVLVVLTAVLIALLEWPARRLVPMMLVLFTLFIGAPVVMHVNNVDTYG